MTTSLNIGLHFDDIKKLLTILYKLVNVGRLGYYHWREREHIRIGISNQGLFNSQAERTESVEVFGG